MKTLFTKTQLGFIVSNALAFTLMCLGKLMVDNDLPLNRAGAGVFVFSEFIIIPILMGMISAWYWKDQNLKSKISLWYSILNCFIAIALSAVFLHEGVICLIIVSPLIFAFIVGGKLIGDKLFKKNNTTLNVSVIGLLMLVFVADSLSKHQYENKVSDFVVINATPDKVWKNVVAFEPIKQKPGFWLFRIGMPSPVAATVSGYYKGAGRKCIFSNGYVFGERIATYDEQKDLTFDIIDQPRDPEIMGHIDIERGQFLLKDNGDGTTTLTGNSWYKLYVFPTWYYDIWAQSITRNVHLRVMEHIKELSEKN